MKPKYLLVDGNNIASRAAHASWATTTLSAEDGTPTAALMFFINSMAKMIAEEQPTHVAVAWDGRSERRHRLLPTYKANRKAVPDEREKNTAFGLMRDFLDVAWIDQFRDPLNEADDVLATWWHNIVDASEIVIATGDKDMLQLLGLNPWDVPTFVRRPQTGGPAERWDEARFETEYGYNPRNWPLVGALTGDTSDNIMGIRGIGPKKALKLLEDHDWHLGSALAEKHPEHRERVLLNYLLMELTTEPPIRTMRLGIRYFEPPLFDTERGTGLDLFLRNYELSALLARYRKGQLWTQPTMPGRSLAPRSVEGRT